MAFTVSLFPAPWMAGARRISVLDGCHGRICSPRQFIMPSTAMQCRRSFRTTGLLKKVSSTKPQKHEKFFFPAAKYRNWGRRSPILILRNRCELTQKKGGKLFKKEKTPKAFLGPSPQWA